MSIRVIVADDELLARNELVRLLSQDPAFSIIATASNGKEAIDLVREQKPDVIFLDIDMPVMSGLEASSVISADPKPPFIVFVTAFHQYAIEAFEANAIDYVTKPVDPARLKKTLDRIKKQGSESGKKSQDFSALETDLIKKGLLNKIIAHRRNSKDKRMLDPSEIFFFRVHLTDVFAAVSDGEWIVNISLKEILASFAANFVQTHKSYLVNVHHVEKVAPMFSGNFEIVLKDSAHTKIPLSRRFAQTLKSRLRNW